MVLTFCGALLSWCLVSSKDVIRDDGSRVILMKHPTWSSEIYGLWETLLSEPFIVLLFPMFWSSNWFYTYQFNDYNHARFNTRTAALNNVLYWSSQIFGSLIFGYCLDLKRFRRSTRARGLWIVLFALTMAIWGGGYAFQKDYTRADVAAAEASPADPSYAWVALDWTSSGYIGPMFLYIFYGAYDAAWQTSVYWLMGALTNNSRKLANYAGWYKGEFPVARFASCSCTCENSTTDVIYNANRYSIGGRCSDVEQRPHRHTLLDHVRVNVGLARRQPGDGAAAGADESAGSCVHRGGPSLVGRDVCGGGAAGSRRLYCTRED